MGLVDPRRPHKVALVVLLVVKCGLLHCRVGIDGCRVPVTIQALYAAMVEWFRQADFR